MSGLFEALRALVMQLADRQLLPVIFYYEFVANAVIACLIIGPLLGLFGTMVVVKRMAFFSQAIGNAALTGVSIGVLLGESLNAPYVSMFAFCILFGVILKYTQQRTDMSNDVLIGVFLSISLALGSSMLLFVSARMNTHVLEGVLFGSILTVNDLDLTVLVVVALLCSAIALPLYNQMLLGSFHRSLAHARGVPVLAFDYLFVVLISLLTVACVKIVGAVLVEALLVIPAAAARNVSRSLRQFVGFSIVIATISCLAGVIVPMQFDLTVPSGGAIVLIAALFFFASVVARGLLGLSRFQSA